MPDLPRRPPDYSVDAGPLRLEMWDVGEDREGRTRYAYRMRDREWGPAPVFEGSDFTAPPGMDERRAAAELLGFLTLKEGDTDEEHFEGYSPGQIRWRDERAERAQLDQIEFEEMLERERERGRRRGRRGVGPPHEWEPGR